MQAVILAAGRGQRLNGGRAPRPKCLHEVGGMPLVHHQLLALADAGIHDVVMVVGFEHQQVREVVGTAARYALNERFAETNSLCSFLLARPLVHGEVLVLNADVLADPRLVTRLAEHGGDALLYDSSSGQDDEHMKVAVRGARLVEMRKDLPAGRTRGENLGMLRFSSATAPHVFAAAEQIAGDHGEQAWLATALNRIAAQRPIHCLDVAGSPWIEIDFPHDLARARTEVFPAVAGPLWRRSRPTPSGQGALDLSRR